MDAVGRPALLRRTTFTVTPRHAKIKQEKREKREFSFLKENYSFLPFLLFDLKGECSVTVKAATTQSSIGVPALPRSNEVHRHAASRQDQTRETGETGVQFFKRELLLSSRSSC